ncbi:MAG: hypothetical protein LLG45_02670 [Actinomycetia bacterium]|nr:hypothetical protein [Actinomycetes bacterium]
MKPQRGGEQHLEEKQEVRAGAANTLPVDTRPLASEPALSEEEAAVLECLRMASSGLTARQLQSRVSCDPGVLERTLATLVERELVARLNTIIPSYSYRRRPIPTHDG